MQQDTATAIPEQPASDLDEALRNAEAQGYLRGRNEAIAQQQSVPSQPPDDAPLPQAQFPRYARRSVWDLP